VINKIYILLPVHNRCEVTQRFVDCLKAQSYQNYHLVLIDDGSTDGTADMVRRQIPSLTVIAGKGDWWWAGALQEGYDWLSKRAFEPTDLVLIINDDTEFEVDFLDIAVKYHSTLKGTLLLAQSFCRETDHLVSAGVQVDWRRLKFTPKMNPDEINCLSTRGLFLNAEDFIALGGFYPKWLPHYLSDYEFTIRACRKGMRLQIDDRLKMWVDENATGYHEFNEESFREFRKKYFAKNSDANPLAWTVFIGLACPWSWKLTCWMRVWYGTTVNILKALMS